MACFEEAGSDCLHFDPEAWRCPYHPDESQASIFAELDELLRDGPRLAPRSVQLYKDSCLSVVIHGGGSVWLPVPHKLFMDLRPPGGDCSSTDFLLDSPGPVSGRLSESHVYQPRSQHPRFLSQGRVHATFLT